VSLGHTLAVDEDGVCRISAPYDPALRLAVRAIPGRYWNQELRAWTIRLGPDRAMSVARLAAGFPAFEPDEATTAALDTLQARRNPTNFVIEAVVPVDGWCLSLCDDWEHPIVEELAARFELQAHREVGRLSVPVVPETRAELYAVVARHRVGVSPRARECIEQGPPTAWPDGARPAAPQWRGWATTTVVDGDPFLVFRTRSGVVPPELYGHPEARRDGEVVLLPLRGRHVHFVEELLTSHRQLLLDSRARRSLERLDPGAPDAAPPPAMLTLDTGEFHDEFRLDILWGTGVLSGISDLGVLVADPSTAPQVDAMVRERGVVIDEVARARLDELLGEHDAGAGLVELSQAHDAELELPATVAGELMPFQRAGVAYALSQRRAFIADEQGLGKTIQALAALEAANAYPAIVVCPASLKLNWLRECERWLPKRSAAAVSGRTGELPEAEILVVNYDVLDAHGEALAARGPAALVLDESHYCKNPKARRTRAAIELSAAMEPDAMRLALTGTPLVNRPGELVPQLRALRRLADFGSGATFERRFEADAARRRLHWHLRSRCYVRRRKEDVLPQLPSKRRITVPVPLTNEAEYRALEKDLIAWLHEAVSDPDQLSRRVDAALRAEALVRLNALRHVAARGKLAAAVEWIESFEESEKLVVFAHHRDIQASLADRFPEAARILGSDSLRTRDENVQRFQSGEVPLCICSLEAASHGITLTAAANVAFLELGWTPAKHDQAEDRIHRIGQDRHVTAWYLLAAETVDERIAALIDHKRAVVGSITDGSEGAEQAVVDRLLRDLVAESPAAAAA